MANKKINATATLFLDTKDAQNDAKRFVNDLKQKLSEIETAADKMSVFKDMVAYIAQVDRALASLKANNKDTFDHMFDGLDINLKQQLESLFGVNGAQLGQLDVLRNKLGELTLKSSIKDVKAFAKEINLLFTSIGINAPFDDVDSIFHGRTTTEYLQRLGSELAKFATVWENLNFNLSGNFGFGNGSSSGGDGIVSEIQMLIDNIEKKNKELLDAKERFEKILEEFNNINKDGISDSYKIDLTEESVKSLTLEYDRLQSELESADASSEGFYNTLTNLIEISLKLKRAFSDISADDGLKNVFQNASAGTGTGEATLYGLLSRYARSKDPVNKDIQKIIDRGGLQNTINTNNALINELKTSSDINAVIQKRIDLYNQLKSKLHEYNIEQNKEFNTDEEEDESFKKLEHMEKEIANLTGATKRLNDIQNVLADLSEDGIVLDDVLQKLYKTLGMETPDVFKERLDSMIAEAKAAMTVIDDIASSGTVGKKESGVGIGGGSGSGTGGAITADVDFTSLENTIKAEAASIANKLDGNTFKVEIVKDHAEDIRSSINDILGAVHKISEHYRVDKNKSDVDNMKKNLLQLLDVVNTHNAGRTSGGKYQGQELSIALLSDGSLSVNYGDHGRVSWDHMAESLVANLNKTLLGDIHSHPLHELFNNNQTFTSDALSGAHGDLGAFRFSQSLGSKIAGMITGNVLRVLDLSSVPPVMMANMQAELAKIEQQYADSGLYSKYFGRDKNGRFGAKMQSTLEDQHQVTKLVESMMYDAFQKVGYSKDYIDNTIFKKYNLTDDAQLTDLATRLVQLVSGAEQAIPPMDRLAKIIAQFGGDATSSKAKTLFEAYDKGELKASDVFNALAPNHNVNESAIQSLMNINNAQQFSPIETLLTNISSILSNINATVGNIESSTKLNSEEQLNLAIKDLLDLKAGLTNGNLNRGIESIYNSKDATKYRYDDVEMRAISAINDFVDDLKIKSESDGLTFSESATKDALELVNKFKTAFTYLQDFGKQTELFTGGRNDLGLYVDPSSGKILDTYDTASEMLTNSNVLDALINQLKSIRDKEFDSTETHYIQQLQPVFEKLSMIVDNLSATLSNFNVVPSEQRLPRMDDIFNGSYEGQVDISNDITNLDVLANKVQEIVAEIRGLSTEVSGIIESISNPFKGDSENTTLSTNVELEQLEKLKTLLLEIKSAVDAKTQAFEEEYVTVDSVVDSEMTSLQSLIDKLQEVVAQVNLVNDGFNNINTNVPNVEIGNKSIDNGLSTENTHYVTDPQGRPVNAYRGIEGAYGGLVSNRYHGGTFWTTNIELAKEYAGEIGKVEKSLLSMKNPMEIDGQGAYWNQIEYIGDNSDEASQKLHQLNATIKQTEEILEHLKTIQPTEQELKNLSRGLISETQNEREIREYTAALEKAKAERDAIFADSSNQYGKKNTNEIVEIAKSKGYDGVIFKDIIDSATGKVTDMSTVMVTFEQDQIHYLETISSTFESAVSSIKNQFGDLTQHISASSDEVESSIRKMVELRGKVKSGEISEDDYNAFISENAIARDYEKLAQKSRAVPDFITGALDGEEFDLKHVIERINGMIENMRERMQNIAKAFGKDGIPLDKLLVDNVDTAPIVETPTNEANISGEVEQLDKLQAILVEVKNAIDAKTKAFSDEGDIVGQVVGKEISALTKLSEIIDGIVPKVNSLADEFSALKIQDINIEQPVVDNATSDGNQSSSGTKDAQPKDPFKDSLRNQKNAFNEYRKNLEGAQYVSDELREKLNQLAVQLQQVDDSAKLKDFKAAFDNVKKEITIRENANKTMGSSFINSAKSGLLNTFNGLTLDQQTELKPELDKAIEQLERYKLEVQEGKVVELNAINETTAALRQKLEVYKEANKEAKKTSTSQKTNAKFGDTASINATAKYNSLTRVATSDQFASSSVVSNALSAYEESYKRMIDIRDRLRNSDVIDDSDREAFKAATTECNNYAKALDKIIQNSLKLKGNKANPDDYMLGSDFDYSDVDSRKAALADFVKQMYGVDVAATDFKDNWNKVVFAVDNGDGTFTQMSATFTEARNEIVAMAGDTKKAQGAFANFFDELKGKFKSIGAYLVASFSFHEVWSVIRQGVQYVREIDSALTELKKVTDETDASYAQFLQDMSKTGSVIGATVKDLTIMAADWSRLGYSMADAAKLAESTAILLNVSEFKDANEASEALISTMQAFQYTADESQHVVDILNEVKITCLLIQ